MPLVLFVCTGNTCRSVMAEALLRRYWELEGDGTRLEIASAGLAAFPEDRATEHVRRLLAEEGIDVSTHKAALLESSLVKKAALILVMTGAHREALLARFPQAASKVFLLKEFAGISASPADIDDPIGGSLEKYRQTLEEIRQCITKFIVRLKGGGDSESRFGQ